MYDPDRPAEPAPAEKVPAEKPRRQWSIQVRALITLAAVLIMTAAAILMRNAFLRIKEYQPPAGSIAVPEEEWGPNSVRAVVVEGNTRYADRSLIKAGRIYPGQNIWSVNKKEAADRILEAFPYIERVLVDTVDDNGVLITVTETEPVCAVFGDDDVWLVVGTNNQVLERIPVTGDRPLRILYFKGAETVSLIPGEQAVADRDFQLLTELMTACGEYEVDGIAQVDITNRIDIKMAWKNQILILMGDETNFNRKLGIFSSALPGIIAQRGEAVRGRFNVTAYSAGGTADAAFFTPDKSRQIDKEPEQEPENPAE
ncbi:MAG: FtsQ-type POTRA domain-containing protein [Oscillospiraceae bacterium]|nr:FtsQ-type POTRA domain-containing protein [Oscillospiraceae bacterium]